MVLHASDEVLNNFPGQSKEKCKELSLTIIRGHKPSYSISVVRIRVPPHLSSGVLMRISQSITNMLPD